MPNNIYLTKSRYTAGLQCLRRLWLNVYQPADWNEAELGSAEEIGLEIGRMAHRLFPGGVLVPERMGAPRFLLLSERFQSYWRSMRRHHLGSRTVLFRCANLESGRSAAGYRRIT